MFYLYPILVTRSFTVITLHFSSSFGKCDEKQIQRFHFKWLQSIMWAYRIFYKIHVMCFKSAIERTNGCIVGKQVTNGQYFLFFRLNTLVLLPSVLPTGALNCLCISFFVPSYCSYCS